MYCMLQMAEPSANVYSWASTLRKPYYMANQGCAFGVGAARHGSAKSSA